MPTISLCMIVKNEEAVLERCLDSIAFLMDEIIIVDTGSTDRTKEIASKYTEKIYDFAWCGDFAAARNEAFSHATMEYIYTADADEILEGENQKKFADLKKVLLPEIEMVQMYYETVTEDAQLYNFKKEYRPKLFKRLRTFTWIDEIHETVRLEPVVYDSDIVITHRPIGNHGGRDIEIFQKKTQSGKILSPKLHHMYAMELLHLADEKELLKAASYFRKVQQTDTGYSPETAELMARESACVLAEAYRREGKTSEFFTQCINETAGGNPCGEICFSLGEYYFSRKEYSLALMWYHNAVQAECILDVHAGGDKALSRLVRCYGALGMVQEADEAQKLMEEWHLPEM